VVWGACLLFTEVAVAGPAADSAALRAAVTLDNVRAHQFALQAIADANGGTRAVGTPGFDASVRYVAGQLVDAGYAVRQDFFRGPDGKVSGNLIAETPSRRRGAVVLAGAHLDSVPEGPGVQDNGSGSAALLEIAIQMAALQIEPKNAVRFAWWGAEESGLVGSLAYVASLTRKEFDRIVAYVELHMIGSPNFVRFIYDGDGSTIEPAVPRGSARIAAIFRRYFQARSLPVRPFPFDGRSAATLFFETGIPTGGVFGGAEGIKSPEEALVFGGTAGDQYDPCYHLACDTVDNVSFQALDEFSDAAAHALVVLGR
jgi:Zn-dependent M28 family amino/carboxypeptidase